MQDVDGRDGELPVGDAKITQVGPGVAGEASPSVKAGPAEVTAHQAEGARVEVSHCGEREGDMDCLGRGLGGGCYSTSSALPAPRAAPSADHTPSAGPHPGCLPCPLLYMAPAASAHFRKPSLHGLYCLPSHSSKHQGPHPQKYFSRMDLQSFG